MRKINLMVIAGLLAIAGCKEKIKTDKFNPNAPVSVDIVVAENQKIDSKVEVNGSIVAADFVELHAETNGRIVFLQVPEGKYIKAGTIIAKLNDADLQAQLEKAKANLELATINEQRNRQLLNVKAINQSDYDVSIQQVKSIKADMAYTQSLIDKTVVKAPFDGQVGLRQVSLGSFIATTTTIATLQKVDNLRVDFTLPEIYQEYAKVGKQVKVEVMGENNANLTATITAIEPQIIASSRNIKVRASIKGKVFPGAYAKIYLGANTAKQIIMVPQNVIIPESKNKQIVIVKNGTAKFVSVKTGYRTSSSVEITEGLKVGDSVIVAGMLFVKEGSKLKIGKTFKSAEINK